MFFFIFWIKRFLWWKNILWTKRHIIILFIWIWNLIGFHFVYLECLDVEEKTTLTLKARNKFSPLLLHLSYWKKFLCLLISSIITILVSFHLHFCCFVESLCYHQLEKLSESAKWANRLTVQPADTQTITNKLGKIG